MADYHYYKGTYYLKDYDNMWSETQPFIVGSRIKISQKHSNEG